MFYSYPKSYAQGAHQYYHYYEVNGPTAHPYQLVIGLQETLLTGTDHRIWSNLGWGGEALQVCVSATGRSGGVMLAWKEISFDKIAEW